jgi:hypothetical protein
MVCPICSREMTSGHITLRSQWLARAVFSPDGLDDGFIQKWLKGTWFDRGLRQGEVDVVSSYARSHASIARAATLCGNCGTLVLPALVSPSYPSHESAVAA